MLAERLRQALSAVKAARNEAMRENAEAENEGRTALHDVEALRRAVHEVAKAARAAGIDISDLVGDTVGVGAYGRD
jgi:hypothetical protein